jgi:hypothetical protein
VGFIRADGRMVTMVSLADHSALKCIGSARNKMRMPARGDFPAESSPRELTKLSVPGGLEKTVPQL